MKTSICLKVMQRTKKKKTNFKIIVLVFSKSLESKLVWLIEQDKRMLVNANNLKCKIFHFVNN
jgi:hypothetical protein